MLLRVISRHSNSSNILPVVDFGVGLHKVSNVIHLKFSTLLYKHNQQTLT